ncbi:DNA (cytosine-5-)-methyltransferase N-terminal subunit [Mycoplasmopsis bovis]|uniref:DNA (cytosine-5-)-methyltransferase N-terminal subunit n=5 Tax=Mycoplasmopsis bovis TaxID=28903 RepID=UPI0018E76D13|nr:DNA (cytosine-5-)-methyltransferase [Mycoplasmopsis bovis]WNW00539.1 DNA (cytosine-5-)-methyltransferase [Mycoplasmopsis bovis]
MKNIKIYELFAGIGSQLKACKNIANSLEANFVSLGACEWFIDAIIGYMKIHYGSVLSENELSRNEMADILSKFTFSADSKQAVGSAYFTRMNEQKLRKIFPYLYGFVNYEYFNKKWENRKIIRGGGQESYSFTNIKDISTLPKNIDILTYSFPCQDISQQGNQKGISKQTRSGLLYEVERILKNNKDRLPKVLLLENVKALASKKFINQFQQWIDALSQLGYKSVWKVINSADYCSVQNRERVFCISYLSKNDFNFPEAIKPFKNLEKIIVNSSEMKNCSELLQYFQYNFNQTKNQIIKTKLQNYTTFNSEAYVYLPTKLGPTLTASGANARLKFYFKHTNELKIMSARQAFLYMGFTENDYLKVKEDNLLSEQKMIYLCGNSISVEVLESIFRQVIKCNLI